MTLDPLLAAHRDLVRDLDAQVRAGERDHADATATTVAAMMLGREWSAAVAALRRGDRTTAAVLSARVTAAAMDNHRAAAGRMAAIRHGAVAEYRRRCDARRTLLLAAADALDTEVRGETGPLARLRVRAADDTVALPLLVAGCAADRAGDEKALPDTAALLSSAGRAAFAQRMYDVLQSREMHRRLNG